MVERARSGAGGTRRAAVREVSRKPAIVEEMVRVSGATGASRPRPRSLG